VLIAIGEVVITIIAPRIGRVAVDKQQRESQTVVIRSIEESLLVIPAVTDGLQNAVCSLRSGTEVLVHTSRNRRPCRKIACRVYCPPHHRLCPHRRAHPRCQKHTAHIWAEDGYDGGCVNDQYGWTGFVNAATVGLSAICKVAWPFVCTCKVIQWCRKGTMVASEYREKNMRRTDTKNRLCTLYTALRCMYMLL
jgi:hypothetical protein